MIVMTSEVVNEAIANYIVVNGAVNTTEGNWHFSASDLAEHFGVTEEYVKAQSRDILDRLNSEIVSEADAYEELDGTFDFDITFYGGYCNVDMED